MFSPGNSEGETEEGEDMEGFTIGQLAKKAGVNVQTIRYYERRGLMPQPQRRWSGYRQYSEGDVERILFIKHAKELGFTLKEISDLLSLRVEPNVTCRDVKMKAMAKIAEIEDRIQGLQKMKVALTKIAARCQGRGPISECPILEALNESHQNYHFSK